MLGLLVIILMLGGAFLSGYMLYLLQNSQGTMQHAHKTTHHTVIEPHRYNFKL